MPRPDAAALIGENLHRLPKPDGSQIRFMHFSTFGQKADVAQRVANRANDVGEAIVNLLETNGYDLGHKSDPEPTPKREGVVDLHCGNCGTRVGQIANVNQQGQARMSAFALQQLSQMAHTCADGQVH
jgi:hypothetical protein